MTPAAATTARIESAIETLTSTRTDAYATGDEVGAEVDYAIDKLRCALQRIRLGVVGTPNAVTPRA